MFWRFGGYSQVSAIDTLLEKQDVTLEELLNEGDLIQELKSHNTKLIEYLRDDAVLEKLLEYVVATRLEPIASDDYDMEEKETGESKGKEAQGGERFMLSSSESGDDDYDKDEKDRSKYAYVAAEILSSESWSLTAALLENETLLRKFWTFLERPAPLDPLQAGYFTKVNEALFDKKTEEMFELFKSIPNVVKNITSHVDSPMIMDLLLKIISMEKQEGGQGIVDWLHSQDLILILLSFLSPEHPWATQTSAGDFLKAIITISANASQNEQSCIGPNSLTRQLVSKACIQQLIDEMLKGGNPLTVGVGIVIEVIRKNNSDYDPEVSADSIKAPTSRDPIYLGSLLGLFAKYIPDFVALMLSPKHTIGSVDGPVTVSRKELGAAFGGSIEPLGFDRFKTCELMAELLHCSNMGLLNEIGAEAFITARDAEREKLRLEGNLNPPTAHHDSDTDGLTIRSPNSSRLGSSSPEDFKRLEVQNGSDDDGFEQVTHFQGIEGDEKDEIKERDTKPDTSMSSDSKLAKFSTFLDKDDGQFVDEPLSSPRLGIESDMADVSLQVKPLSPTKKSADNVLAHRISTTLGDENVQSTNDPVHKVAAASESEKPTAGSENQTSTPTLTIPAASASEAEGLLPHPDDKPAPLFSGRQVDTPAGAKMAESTTLESQEVAAQVPIPDEAAGSVGDDSTFVENADISQINPTGSNPLISDVPVVGDYLKMQFVEHKVVPTILDFFFRFPWNNFLHNVVYDVVQQVFNGTMTQGYNRTLAIDVFKTGNITARIVEGQKRSDEMQTASKMRLGYMGHLTLIAEEVVKFTDRHSPDLLSDFVLEQVLHPDWVNYVEVTLAETRERDNAVLGGVRPNESIGGRSVSNTITASGSSALADAGLNGTAGLAGGFAGGADAMNTGFSNSSLMSGFGDSSDEEDEELEDDFHDDDRGNDSAELSQYISTSNTTTTTSTNNAGSELEPPSSAPPLPPPPPLNIPPSRARRQLAARLALHQKTQEAASSESNGESSAFPASTGRLNGINLDPFADHDSDDDLEIEGGPSDAWALPGYDNIGRSEAPSGFDDNFDADHVGAPFNDTPSSSSTAPLPANSFVELTPLYGSAFESSGTISDGGEVLQTTDSESGSSAAKPRSISPLKSGFSSLWPFGQGSKGLHKSAIDEAFGIVNREETSQNQNENLANDFFDQTDTDSSDDGFDGIGEKEASGAFDGKRDKGRRPSLTTEAKSRTSLDDDDEEIEIVTAKADVKAATGANLAHVSAGKTEDKAVESQKKAEETLNHDKGT